MPPELSRAEYVDEVLRVLLDRGRDFKERDHAAMLIRWANEGCEPWPDGVLKPTDRVAPEWRTREVIDALVEVASDRNENLLVSGEAAEALSYIAADEGVDSIPLARLLPEARAEVEAGYRQFIDSKK